MNDNNLFEDMYNSYQFPRWEDLPDIELYMDQVITLTGKFFGNLFSVDEPPLTPSMINNYVKNEIIPPPIKKKYSRTHLFRLIIICIMKPVLPISAIGRLIDTMLKTKTEAQVLDFFCEQYENELKNTYTTLNNAAKEHKNEAADGSETLCFLIMRAATISGTGKFCADNLLSQMAEEESAQEKPKKEKSSSKKE